MKTRTKILVDRVVGLPLAWVLNGAARLLGKTLRRDHSLDPSRVRTVVVSKYVGMGSILQATPLLRAIRSGYPDAKLVFLTGRSCRELTSRLEGVDRVLTIDDRDIVRLGWTTFRILISLIRLRADLFFDLELYSAYASIVSLMSLARNRVGFYRESAQHKRGNYTHLMYFNPRSPIRHIYSQLGLLVGCPPAGDDLDAPRVVDADRNNAASALQTAGVEGEYLVVNPNASDLMVERRWPAEKFGALASALAERYGLAVVLIGSKGERDHVQRVIEHVEAPSIGKVVNLGGSLSLGGLLALLEGASAVVTNDTGPMHMAWALGVPTVGLFGPVDPKHYGQSGPSFRFVYEPVYCSPCVHEVDEPPCMGNNVCMKRIGVETVMCEVDQLLCGSPPADERPAEKAGSPFYTEANGLPLGRVVRDAVVVKPPLKVIPSPPERVAAEVET